MGLFGSDEGSQGTPDHSMQKVLDATLALGQKPLETLSPEEARNQPLPGDGAKEVMRERGMDPNDDLGVATKDFEIPGPGGPIKARLYGKQDETETKPVVVYWHGGGFVIADIDAYDPTPRALAKATDCIIVSCHYRQAPEDKFPAAHEDAWAAWKWVTENAAQFGGDGERFAVMGESAGGNLALNVALRARDEGCVRPATNILVYPMAAGATDSPSYIENADAKPLNKALMEWFYRHYVNGPNEMSDPRIDLVSADLSNLAPTLIIAAEIDPLRSEGAKLAERLQAAGVEVDRECYEGVAHEFFGMGLIVKDAAAAQTRVATKLKKGFAHGIVGKLANALT